MKNLLFFILLSLFLTGCASFQWQAQGTRPVGHSKQPSRPNENKSTSTVKKHHAIWDLLKSEQVSLQLTNVDNGANLTIILQKGLTKIEVPQGHWELTGFEEKGQSFVSMNSSKKFVFLMKAKTSVYAGSIVTGCPKLDSSDLTLLRDMKFFNRYPFSSSKGLCELVVGDDFAKVRTELKKTHKSKKLNLINGL